MLKQKLKHWLGFSTFRTQQKEVIQLIVHRCSAAAIFPTGLGKSLYYRLPALLLPHLILVVSSLLALIKNQIDLITTYDVPAARLDSTLTTVGYDEIIVTAKNGNPNSIHFKMKNFVRTQGTRQ